MDTWQKVKKTIKEGGSVYDPAIDMHVLSAHSDFIVLGDLDSDSVFLTVAKWDKGKRDKNQIEDFYFDYYDKDGEEVKWQ